MKHGIKSWAEDDRPREKLINKGPLSLSDAELFAIIIGSGYQDKSALDLSKAILARYQNSLAQLQKVSYQELLTFKGVGPAKAIFVLTVLEIGRRLKQVKSIQRKAITSSRDAYEVLEPILAHKSHEEFWVLFMNNRNHLLQKVLISKGGMTGTIVDCREVFRNALELRATCLILAHNHPSGSLQASHQDKELTKKLVEAGEIMNVTVLDHLIISENGYLSFSDEAMIH